MTDGEAGASVRPDADERRRTVHALSDATLAHLGFEELLVELLDRTRDALDADTAAILLFDPATNHLVATVARGLEEEVRQGVRIPLGGGFAGRIAALKEAVIIDHVDDTSVLNQILIDKGIKAMLGVPLLSEGQVLGVLHVGTLGSRRFTEDDADLLRIVADRAALVVQANRSVMERDAAVALQRSLMPSRLPNIAGLEFAARYVPGEATGVGGDWYDVFHLPSGWLCVVVGDVAGRGLRAAVVMGRLRSALRAYALESRDPADVLARLDRKLAHFEPGEMATVLCAMVEPSFDRMHLSSAGHLPPALAVPGAAPQTVPVPSDPPIGVRLVSRRRSHTVELPVDTVLCMYSDGLVERRGESIDEGLERVRAAMEPGRPAEATCVTVMNRLVGGGAVEDDIAVLIMRRRPAGEGFALEITVPSEPSSLVEIRSAVRRWLSSLGPQPHDLDDFVVAIGEAASNAIEHAYGPSGGDVHIRLEHAEGRVVATIRDMGTWRPPRGQNRGRGTSLMRALVDEVEIDHGQTGTTVVLRKTMGGSPS